MPNKIRFYVRLVSEEGISHFGEFESSFEEAHITAAERFPDCQIGMIYPIADHWRLAWIDYLDELRMGAGQDA